MQSFRSYIDRLHILLARATKEPSPSEFLKEMDAALDGQPRDELRRSVAVSQLRSAGAFFTGSRMARRVVSRLTSSLVGEATVLDPACGAGDLLIACTQHLPHRSDFASTLVEWKTRILGRDVEPEFVRATRVRLALAALRREPSGSRLRLPPIDELFPEIRAGSSLSEHELYQRASHIVINPPFTMVDAPDSCSWGGGKVNGAALFMEACVTRSKPGTRVFAILPEVLRSGSRYEKWRQMVAEHASISGIETLGQFDRVTDVDVFMVLAVVRGDGASRACAPWTPLQQSSSGRITDKFDISVGAVVPHRDPREGPWLPFLQARGLPSWEAVSSVGARRRFKGRAVQPPFVVVRRTSRPGDKSRAVATLVTGREKMAVENHLLVLRPKDGSSRACRQLLAILRDDTTSEILDKRIRCRHLTVQALGELPWRD
jgi:N-6 DNA Methylase